MNNEKLFKILYKTQEIQKFLINDLFEELKLIINIKLCINIININEKQRELNFLITKNTIDKFLKENIVYLNKLKDLFKTYTYNALLDHLIIAFVFYIAQINENYKYIDVFTNKASICFNKYNYMLAI